MSDEQVADHLDRYGEWIEHEVGHTLRSSRSVLSEDPLGLDEAVGVIDVERRGRSLGNPRRTIAALVVAALVVVGVMLALRPAGDEAAIYTRSGDPEGPLFVLPADDSPYVVSGGLINSRTRVALRATERLWIGTPDDRGTTFRDVIQVCVSILASECSSMPTPNFERSRVEVDGRFFSVASTDDGSNLVVSDKRDLLHVSARGGSEQDPLELATLLAGLAIDENGHPSIDVEDSQVIFAAQSSRDETERDRFYPTAFQVGTSGAGDSTSVSTNTGALNLTLVGVLPAELALDKVSIDDEIIDNVSVTKLEVVVPDQEAVRMLQWQASPNRLISVSSRDAPFAELTAVAQSLVETSEAEWRAALPDLQTFEESLTTEDD